MIALRDAAAGAWLTFSEPEVVLAARSIGEVRDVLAEVDACVRDNGWTAAGFVTYEAAPAFDASLPTHPAGYLPLVYFELFANAGRATEWSVPGDCLTWSRTTSDEDYRASFERIMREIAAGNVYQVNHTVRLAANVRRLPALPEAPYGAWIDTEEFTIASASPELFFSLDGSSIRSRPMKGTVGRGLDVERDLAARRWLRSSEKNRAENLMITDMVRNDIGRIAEPGSVVVESLFDVARYPTVWQMTSSVRATTQASIVDLFAGLFPAASITGAPKRGSMQLIQTLEAEPREIYTGAIGFITPDRKYQFNVAIRTAWLDKRSGRASYGVGGGIVWDSMLTEELDEIDVKARVLGRSGRRFNGALLETMRWEAGEIRLFNSHMDRLVSSAEYFGITLARERVTDTIDQATSHLAGDIYRVRLMVGASGEIDIETSEFDPPEHCQRVQLARTAIDPGDVYLYHKTTNRDVYLRASSEVDADCEAILFNQDGFVTESVIANLVFQIGGELFTPPVDCGLLPGTLRERLLHEDVLCVRRLHVDDIEKVEALFLVNSLRGWRRAEYVPRSVADYVELPMAGR